MLQAINDSEGGGSVSQFPVFASSWGVSSSKPSEGSANPDVLGDFTNYANSPELDIEMSSDGDSDGEAWDRLRESERQGAILKQEIQRLLVRLVYKLIVLNLLQTYLCVVTHSRSALCG
jgi:hypothetical protein